MEALFAAATLATADTAPNFLYAVLTAAGVVALIRWRRHRWLIVSHAIMCALWVVALWAPVGRIRYMLVGTWYADENRLESLLPVTGIPLAIAGAVLLLDGLAAIVSRRGGDMTATADVEPSGRPASRSAVPVAVGISVLLLATQLAPSLMLRTQEAAREYRMTDDAPLLSPDEATLLKRVDDHVPEDGVVIGSPWTGTSLVYTYAERVALLPAIFGDRSSETLLLLESLRNARPGSPECAAIEEEGVTHVLDFGRREVHGGRHILPGIERLASSEAVELVDSEGRAELYAVTACDG